MGVARGSRARLIVAVGFAIVALVLAILWSQRKPIATGFVDRTLAARGVPARYRIARLGVYDQRIEQVVLGDPRDPDLTAAWVELHLGIGLSGPYVERVRAHGVRLRGRLVGGRVSLGAVDRLMPAPSGAPLALPDIDVDLSDARMRLATPAGTVGLAVEGSGRLSDGFRGTLAATARTFDLGACRSDDFRASFRVAVADGAPRLTGPARLARLTCGTAGMIAVRADLDAALTTALAPREVRARMSSGPIEAGEATAAALDGTLAYVVAGATTGELAHADYDLSLRGLGWRGHRVAELRTKGSGSDYGPTPISIAGSFGHAYRATGTLRADGIAVSPATLGAIVRAAGRTEAAPLGPIARALAGALAAAGRAARAGATFAWAGGPNEHWAEIAPAEADRLRRAGRDPPRERTFGGTLSVSRLRVASASGVALTMVDGGRIEVEHDGDGIGPATLDGAIAFGGGGLPAGRLRLDPTRGGVRSGLLAIAPYAAGGARVALTPVRFMQSGTQTRFATTVTLDGPLGDGRIDGLTLPLTARVGTDGSLRVNEGCAPLGFARLAIAGLVAGPTRLALCPTGGALVSRFAGGSLGGGAATAGAQLTGRLGSAPVTIAAARLGFALGRPGFVADALAVRLGEGTTVSRLDIGRLAGTFDARGIAGRFEGLGGKIGAVPLILSDGAGTWRLAGGMLDLGGRLRVADEAQPARFSPLVSEDVTLRLAGGRIVAGGTLREPVTGTAVTRASIRHDLGAGTGEARLDVPGLTFTEALQPERLTRLTLGVVANVRGTVKGAGTIRWTPAGATSEGRFATDRLDLAAAFGPVTGIATTLTFTDLLGLASAPGQVATIVEANPGIAVRDGVIRYRLLPDQKIAIEDGRWPFSGGLLMLEPTLLDFAATAERRMTFRVEGMDAAKFVEQFDFKNVSVTGTFDGTLPIVFDATGGRIENGRLAVRRGGGVLAYVGEVSNADLGMFGSLAFDALKRMRYDRLAIELNGSLDGELVSRVLFDGTNETPKEAVRKNGLLSQFSNLPFRFNITIRAPFRGLLNAARSLNDPRGLIEQARQPAVALPGSAPVQPPPSPVQPK